MNLNIRSAGPLLGLVAAFGLLPVSRCRAQEKPALPVLETPADETPADGAGADKADANGAFTSDRPEIKQLARQIKRDSRRISARQINLFHRRLIQRVVLKLPESIRAHYSGLAAVDHGRRRGQRVHGSIGLPLSWKIESDLVVFVVRLSAVRSKASVVRTRIDGDELFVTVDFIDGDRALDDILPELGGRSVRQVLAPLGVSLKPE